MERVRRLASHFTGGAQPKVSMCKAGDVAGPRCRGEEGVLSPLMESGKTVPRSVFRVRARTSLPKKRRRQPCLSRTRACSPFLVSPMRLANIPASVPSRPSIPRPPQSPPSQNRNPLATTTTPRRPRRQRPHRPAPSQNPRNHNTKNSPRSPSSAPPAASASPSPSCSSSTRPSATSRCTTSPTRGAWRATFRTWPRPPRSRGTRGRASWGMRCAGARWWSFPRVGRGLRSCWLF